MKLWRLVDAEGASLMPIDYWEEDAEAAMDWFRARFPDGLPEGARAIEIDTWD